MASAWVKGSETTHRSAASCSRDSRPSQPTRPAAARMTMVRRLEKNRLIFILSAHQAIGKLGRREPRMVSGRSRAPSVRNDVSSRRPERRTPTRNRSKKAMTPRIKRLEVPTWFSHYHRLSGWTATGCSSRWRDWLIGRFFRPTTVPATVLLACSNCRMASTRPSAPQ